MVCKHLTWLQECRLQHCKGVHQIIMPYSKLPCLIVLFFPSMINWFFFLPVVNCLIDWWQPEVYARAFDFIILIICSPPIFIYARVFQVFSFIRLIIKLPIWCFTTGVFTRQSTSVIYNANFLISSGNTRQGRFT